MKSVYNDELYHYGKLGMKWGRKNTPNKDVLRSNINNVNNFKGTTGQKVSIGLAKIGSRLVSEKTPSNVDKKAQKQAFRKEVRQMNRDAVLHPVHSTVEQFKLIKNKPLKALNMDLKTVKELNDSVRKRVEADKSNRQKHINNGSKILGNLFK